MAPSISPIDRLPNEILASALETLSAKELIISTSTSRRFYSVAVRILYRRLLDAAPLPDNELILECYHPSAKISTPYLCCRYLGTKLAGEGAAVDERCPTLGDLPKLYSSFQPVVTRENRRRQFRPEWPQAAVSSGEASREDEVAMQELFLDEGELFTQLCAVTNVVKESSRPGFYVSHINTCDGVIRVWREWLADMASASTVRDAEPQSSAVDLNRFLWVDPARNVGLRFRVRASPSERMPLICGPGDDAPVSYSLIYEELLVRTSMLLFAVEASAVQEVARSSKAVVISQYDGTLL